MSVCADRGDVYTLTHSDSSEIDMLETVVKHTSHPLIQVVKVFQGDQFSRKMITPTAVIHAYSF